VLRQVRLKFLSRDIAATLDALAGYLLSHQQGFAIENERPLFMSRAHASEYRESLDELRMHTNRSRPERGDGPAPSRLAHRTLTG